MADQQKIRRCPHIQKVHMLLTSRPTGLAKKIGLLTSELEIQREDVDPDIEKCVKFRVERMTSAQLIPDDISILTSRFFHERAEGMFLWVSLILDQLENYEESLSFHDVLDRFESVPSDIQGLYRRRALTRTKAKESLFKKATMIFGILLCSAQPLTTSAFALAMSNWPESCTTHKDLMRRSDFRFEYTCKNACGSLIRIVDNTIQLCLPTAREFLLKECLDQGLVDLDLPASHALLAEICLRYLMLEDVDIPQGDEEPDGERFPLLAYALAYWPLHVRSSSDRTHNYKETIRQFFSTANMARLHMYLRPSNYWNACFLDGYQRKDLIVHVTVYFDLSNLFQTLSWGSDGSETTSSVAPGDELILDLNAIVDARNSLGDTALHVAIHLGLPQMLQSLLQLGADPNSTNCHGMNALHRAAQGDDIDVLKIFLELTDNIEVQASDGKTPLLCAIDFGIIKALLNAGANVNARRRRLGQTRLHFAAEESSPEVVKILLEKGADVNAVTDLGKTSLFRAASAGIAANVRRLLDAGAELLPERKRGWKPLHVASRNGSVECIKLLIDCGICPSDKANNGCTAIHIAAWRGHCAACEVLLGAGCNPNDQDRNGTTALIIAAEAGHESIVNLLQAAGASVNTVTLTNWTALSIAATNGHAEVVRLLLDHGAEKNFVTSDRRPMLLTAIDRGYRDVVNLLIERGINLDSQWESWTPLCLAAFEDDMTTVNQLLEKGVDIHFPGPHGLTILHDAIYHGRHELANRLLDKGFNVNACSHKSWTVLHEAVKTGQLDIATRLIRGEALVDAPDVTGWTPLHDCCQRGHLDLLNLLLKEHADILSRTKLGSFPLGLAAYHGHLLVVDRLIQELHGQQMPVDTWNSASNEAALGGHLEVLKRLLKEGLDIEVKDRDGRTPLMCAITNNHQAVTEFLISRGADTHTTDKMGNTILHWAAWYGMISLVNRLLAESLNPWSPDSAGATPLHLAVEGGHVNVVRGFLNHRSNTIQDHSLYSDVVYVACEKGNLVILDLLLQTGCGVHALDRFGKSTITAAAKFGHKEVLDCLLEKSVDASRPDRWGYSPLHHAADSGHEGVVASLIHHGVPIDPITKDGITPLLSATIGRRFQCIDLLINVGADPTIKDIFGRTALNIAVSSPSLFARMGSWSQSFEPTDPILLETTRIRAVQSLFQHICTLDPDDANETWISTNTLITGLILLKEYGLACIGILILAQPSPGLPWPFLYACDICLEGIDIYSTAMRACQTCTIRVCEPCFGRYDDERQHDDCLCEGHEFLTIRGDDWDELEPKYDYSQDKYSLVREDWFSKLRQRFSRPSDTELDPC